MSMAAYLNTIEGEDLSEEEIEAEKEKSRIRTERIEYLNRIYPPTQDELDGYFSR